jgi:MFS family permease
LIYSIVSPFFGIMIDKIGHRCTLSIISSSILILDQGWSCFFPRCDRCTLAIMPLFLQGIANSLTYSLQFGSVIAFTCEPHLLGTAFGIIWSSNNIF